MGLAVLLGGSSAAAPPGGIGGSAAEHVAPTPISFPTSDGGLIHADLYGAGERAVILAHGGRFAKESWAPQAAQLAAAGFRVLALDFRGYGESRGPGDDDPLAAPLYLDILAAVRHLRAAGAASVYAVGGSMGGTAAADAVIEGEDGEIERIVLLAAGVTRPPERLAGRKLFIIARDDPTASGTPRLVRIREQYEKVPEPKELVILEGTAHAQALFETGQGERLMEEILRFLRAP
jgi:pimeloyl-ACP methyl ester carboxylesterase